MYRFYKPEQPYIPDPTDLQILGLLQQDCRMQVREIAGLVHKSPSPVHSRIQKLQRLGFIERYVAVLNRQLLGRPVLMMALVRLNQHGSDHLREFSAHISRCEQVTICLHLSGEFDFLLQVTVHHPSDYEQFLTEKLCCLPVVERVQSSLVLHECKVNMGLPLG